MKKFSSFLLAALLCCTWSTARADELTVADGTNRNSYIPFQSGLANYYQHAQVIYEASELAAMNGSSIHQLIFYLDGDFITKWGNGLFKVSLAEVEEADFGTVDADAAFNKASLTQVFFDAFSVIGSELFIEFEEPFAYNGGNLLLDVQLPTPKEKLSASFYGTNTTTSGAIHGVYGYSWQDVDQATVSQKLRFIPKTTFTYGEKSSCTKPTGLVAYGINPTGATIGWTSASVDSYTLAYKTLSASKWTTVENATTPVVLSDLTEYSTYIVHLTAHCGEEVSQYAATSFSTPCSPKSADEIPFDYGFEDITYSILNLTIPECWYKIANGDYPYVKNEDAHSGNNCLLFQGGSPITECMIILPKFETPYKDLALSFWYKNASTSSTNGYGQIGYITDMRFASYFTAIQDLEKVTEYTYVENVSLASIPNNAYIAIRLTGGTSAYAKMYIDDIELTHAGPSCPKPSDLDVSEISMTSAIISWTKGEADASVLEYKASDEAVWTSLGTQESPYNLTGLTRNSSYDVRVKNACGGLDDSGYISTTFSTLCTLINADPDHPYVEDFNPLTYMGEIPDCWDDSERDVSYNTWTVQNSEADVRSGQYIYYENGKYSHYGFLKTPIISINGAPTLSFWYKNPGAVELSVYYSIDSGEKNLLVGSLVNQTDWIEYSIALPLSCIGHNIVLAFKANGTEGKVCIDDVKIECAETCPAPTNLTVGNETASGADFSWDAGGTESQWQYLCLPAGETADWTSEAVKTVTTNSVTVTGLNPATDYTIYLRADCGSEDGVSLDISQDFHTECLAEITSLTCDFEEAEGYKKGEYPECWIARYSSTPVYTPVITDEGTPYSGDQHLYMHGGERQYIILPRFEQEVKSLQVSFSFMKNNDTWFTVGSMTDPDNISTFYSIEVLSGTGYERKTEYVLSGARTGDHYLVFLFYPQKTTAELYLDDIVVEKAPTCFAPTNVRTASAPTENSAELTWTPTSAESNWVLQTSQDGIDWSADKEVSELPCTLTGLNASTSYFVRVKAVCSEEESSEWSEIFEFRTACDGSINVPWTETFEGMADEIVPYCWDNSASTSLLSEKTDPTAVWCTFTLYGNTIIGMWDEYVDEGTVQINTPTINLPASPEQALTFDYTNTTTADIKLDVKISKDGGSTFEQIGQYGYKKDLEPIEEAINLGKYAGKSVIIQFFAEAVSEGDGAIILDNVKIDKAPGAPTYIDETEADIKAIKLLRDGQLIIIRGEKTYNVTGQAVK